ncbi:MAG: dihydroorotate dehydrogenase electron transfer subunit [Thermoplasmata archaeon]|jgi:dihydroorotate dehydrogenase electron transfer subunit|nr:MAG: dihydroorotate dehydrogenase electron transfer subunit [Aciduliprofundum sp.]HEU12496.1 dihydroorotate dehydrogenase electron transfer subunit [Euryarchaeota archaeon]
MIYERVYVKESVRENRDVYTLLFESGIRVIPGQFAMVWIPGADEFPMSFSYTSGLKGFTFKVVGKGTETFSKLREGDSFFIRGPYGKGYMEYGQRATFISGGTGISSLAPFIEISKFSSKRLIMGARSKENLYFIERLRDKVDELIVFTEDGSYGRKGLATDGLRYDHDVIYACGPERMIRKILDISVEKDIQIFASLERMMKCGIGICDSCTINGYRVCVDGPVFSRADLINMPDLGRYTRLPSGRRVRIGDSREMQ